MLPTSRDNAIVGVIGANSLLGEGLLPLLLQRGKFVAAFSRRPGAHPSTPHTCWLTAGQALPGSGKIQQWIALLPIWLLPMYFPWLAASGATHIVALSSTSLYTKTDSSDPAERALTQRIADSEGRLAEWAQAHGIQWTILRPTLIYGYGRDRNITTLARMVRRFRFFPLFGPGKGLRQPVHADDVSAACIAALDTPMAWNRAFNLSGTEAITYREMVGRIFDALGQPPRFVQLPMGLFTAAIMLLRIFPPFRKWTPAMIERMNRDMVFDHSEATHILGFRPRVFVLESRDLPCQQ